MEQTYYSEWIAASNEASKLRKENSENKQTIIKLQRKLSKLNLQSKLIYQDYLRINGKRRLLSRLARKRYR
jgi:hypothetical protein